MKNSLQAVMVASLLVASASGAIAQETDPQFELIGEVNIAAFGITPTDIAFHEGDVFISCFASNRQIVRISDVLTTNPTLSTFAVTASAASGGQLSDPPPNGPITYEGGRGLTSITVHPDGRVLAAGDAGNPASGWTGAVVLEYDNSGALLQMAEIPDPFIPGEGDPIAVNRLNVARYFGDNGILLGTIFGAVLHANDELDALIPPHRVGGYPNFTRGIAFVGDDIFVRTTSSSEDKIQRIAGGSLGSLEDYDWEGFQFAELGPQTFNTSSGIQAFDYQGANPMTYIVANYAGSVGLTRRVNFYDPNVQFENYPTSPLFEVDDVELGVGQLLALGFATTDEGQYMFLGRADTGAGSNTIQIWGIDGAQLVEAPVGELGDINGDGVINVEDVTELGNLLAAANPPPLEVGDINNDGVVNDLDVTALAELIANPQ